MPPISSVPPLTVTPPVAPLEPAASVNVPAPLLVSETLPDPLLTSGELIVSWLLLVTISSPGVLSAPPAVRLPALPATPMTWLAPLDRIAPPAARRSVLPLPMAMVRRARVGDAERIDRRHAAGGKRHVSGGGIIDAIDGGRIVDDRVAAQRRVIRCRERGDRPAADLGEITSRRRPATQCAGAGQDRGTTAGGQVEMDR